MNEKDLADFNAMLEEGLRASEELEKKLEERFYRDLNAYGDMAFSVGGHPEDPEFEEHDWVACLDAVFDEESGHICWEVVVDCESAGFTDRPDRGHFDPFAYETGARDLEALRGLPDEWFEVGCSQQMFMDPLEVLEGVRKRWNEHIDDLMKEANDWKAADAQAEYDSFLNSLPR